MKKTVIILILFILVYIANSILIVRYQHNAARLKKQELILAELNIEDKLNDSRYEFQHIPPVYYHAANTAVPDDRLEVLQRFLQRYNSVLFDYAADIIDASDKNQFDYRLLPAIAMQESGLCKKIPANSFNCWGWGITGGRVIKFDSYREAIYSIAAGIKKNYIDKRNLKTIRQIMTVYTHANDGSWAEIINHVISTIE